MKTKIISSTKWCIRISLLLFLITSPTKAQNWEFVGLDSMVIKQLYVSGDSIWAGTAVRSGANINSGLYFTSNGGSNWIQLDSAFGSGIAVGMEYIDDGELYLVKGLSEGSWAGKVYKTTNNGFSWDTINISDNGIRWLDTSPFNKNEVYALDVFYYPSGVLNSLFKSTDGGENWQTLGPFPSSSHGSALTFAFDLIDSMSLYATVDTQFDRYLFKSTSKGDNWNYISIPPISPSETKTDLFLSDRIYLYSYYKATDNGGLTWYDAYGGLADNIDYLSFYQDKETTKLLYVLRTDGLYSSKNDTIFWSLVTGSEELPIYFGPNGFYSDRDMHNIFIEPNRKKLYLGTAEGIYKTSIITNLDESDKKDLDFSLSPNYPNPFNPTTTIEYQINKSSVVSLKVYDILGNEIATLVNEEKPTGKYHILFNAENIEKSNLASGIYFYQLYNGTSLISRKMTYLK
jgi:hypothetical protein